MQFKFLHAADLHLDSPLIGLDQYEGAPVDKIRSATRRALENMVNLAITQQVNFVLLAGDNYDGDWKHSSTGMFFCRQMAQLKNYNIPVYLIYGNHDAASVITKQLPLPDNVYAFSADKPQTYLLEDLKVAIHGQSFKEQAENKNMTPGYPPALFDYFNIGLLHTSAAGRDGHDRYAPCTVEDLVNKGYDYWALGHIHQREVLAEHPAIVYAGNLQGRHAHETGAKGCLLVSCHHGVIMEKEFVALDEVRWHQCRVDVSNVRQQQDFLKKILDTLAAAKARAGDRLLAARLIITGATPLHYELMQSREDVVNLVRTSVQNFFDDGVWLEKIILNTSDLKTLEELKEQGGALGYLVEFIQGLDGNDELQKELNEVLKELRNKVSQTSPELKDLLADTRLPGHLLEAGEMVLAKLMKG